MFSLGLLNGEGFPASIQMANSVGDFNATRINELWNQRNQIQDAITDTALRATGLKPTAPVSTGGGTGGSGAPASTEYPDLTATLQKEVRDLTGSAEQKSLTAGRINGLIGSIEAADGLEGAGGTAAELFKGIVGAQGDVSLWKSDFTRLINSEVVNNLPPGVASDKDIELIKSGFPQNNWDKDTLVKWLQAYRKVTNYVASRDKYRANYIERTGRQTGWEAAFRDSYEAPANSIDTTGEVGDDEVFTIDDL